MARRGTLLVGAVCLVLLSNAIDLLSLDFVAPSSTRTNLLASVASTDTRSQAATQLFAAGDGDNFDKNVKGGNALLGLLLPVVVVVIFYFGVMSSRQGSPL
eukprot:TRINITY_DN96036_c0_g1_i1.p1 TRINITY_DN96036_c0_g1~~TRINITY_DN96036_c0_g1_i1.p1  ORF type:complete len:101 (+),score=14.54 TRINITY_DN96036_c0_g1_i1:79-381(+)